MTDNRANVTRQDVRTLKRQLDQVCTRDFGRLFGRWRRLSAAEAIDPVQWQRLQQAVDTSMARRQERVAAKPSMELDASLPITARADAIIEHIRKHQVLIIAGATGSGKTTQLPQLCLAAGRGEAGLIGCTQPRRLAARSVARRVAEEMHVEIGDKVGFQVRFHDNVSDATLVKFMTDGILLAETQADRWLSAYDTLIIDEAHERSLNIDFLLGYLKGLLKRRRNLKVIITSATIDTARFAEHFDNAPVIKVEGRSHPVEVRWRPADGEDVAEGSPEHIAHAVEELTAHDPRGDILVFLPGEREIRDTRRYLERRQYRHTEVVPLYARLSAREQDSVFHPGSRRRIVLATNVAETSLTVPRIRAVIDTGTARVKRYSQRRQIDRLHIEPVSQSAADQRKGRCGRLGPGVCIRLYAEDDFALRPRFTDPELLRSSLANVILRMLSLRLGDVEAFPFLDMPEPRAVSDGYRRLAEVMAIDDKRQLTTIGKELARLPIDVQLARMLYEARQQNVLAEVLVIVAFLSVRDPRQRPAEARQQADAAHREFADPASDLMGMLKLWAAWNAARSELTSSKFRDWCQKHYLGFLRLREWREVHRQLKLAVADWHAGHHEAREPAAVYQAVHLSLLAGLPTQVAHKDEHGVYRGTRERKFELFPGSALAKKPPAWVFAGQIMDIGGKVWAMHAARIEPTWIERQAGHLVRCAWRDPHWSRKRGAVVADEQVTLFGLILVSGRTVTFRKQDPAQAHAIFLREGLARGEVDGRAAFLKANRKVLVEAEDVEARERRQGLIRDDEELAAFFRDKLPESICDVRALDAWYRKAGKAEREALYWSLEDVLEPGQVDDGNQFPEKLDVDGQHYRLSYQFEPGSEADGVSVHVPLDLLAAFPQEAGDWLVPGLLEEKVATLIRGLPKSLRRNFVPAPDFARAFLETAPDHGMPLPPALAKFLVRATGVIVAADNFSPVALPDHLRMRYVLEGAGRKHLAANRDLATLQRQWQGQARSAFAEAADIDLAREQVTTWDFGTLPGRVATAGKPDAYPALVATDGGVAMRVFARNDQARHAHRQGVRQLLWLESEKSLAKTARTLPVGNKTALAFAPNGSVKALRADIAAGAFTDVLADEDLMVRDAATHDRLCRKIERDLFATAIERLKLLEPVLALKTQVNVAIKPSGRVQPMAAHADLADQIRHLFPAGWARDLPAARLRHYPRYLEAMLLRAERLRRDPGKDKRHLESLLPAWQACWQHADDAASTPEFQRLRWLLEEWRVSLFAQELKTAEPVSAKRVAQALEALEQAG